MTIARNLVERLTLLLATPRELAPALGRVQQQITSMRPAAGPVVSLVARLHDPELDPAWLPALAPVSRTLVVAVATALGAPADSVATLSAELDEVHVLLGDVKVIAPRPGYLAAPLACYHLDGWKLVHSKHPTPYPAVAPVVHVQLRSLERGMAARIPEFGRKLTWNLWHYLLSARLMSRYGPQATPALESELRDALGGSSQGAVAHRIALIESTMIRCKDVTPRTEAKRRAHLQVLLGLRDHAIHPVSAGPRTKGPRNRGRSVLFDDPEETIGAMDLSPSSPGSTRVPSTEVFAEGESAFDYPELHEWEILDRKPSPITGPPRRLAFREIEPAIMRRLGLPHDPSIAQPYELAEVYACLLDRRLESMDLAQLRESLFALLLLYYGITPETLASMPVSPGEPPTGADVALDVETERLWVRLRTVALGAGVERRALELSRPGSEWASIPILPLHRQLLRRMRALAPTALASGMSVFGERAISPTERLMTRLRSGRRVPVPGLVLARRLARGGWHWLVHHGLPDGTGSRREPRWRT